MSKKMISILSLITVTLLAINLSADPLPIGHWNFNNNNANDISGNNRHGTLNGNAAIIDDPDMGKVLSLDGQDSYVRIPSFTYTNTENHNCTLSFWFKAEPESRYFPYMFNHGPEFDQNNFDVYLRKSTEGTLTTRIRVNNADSRLQEVTTMRCDDNLWHLYTAVKSGTTLSLYIDGQLDWTDDIPSDAAPILPDPGYDIFLGARLNKSNFTTERFFKGSLDDVRIYDEALTAEQVERIYSGIAAHNFSPQQDDLTKLEVLLQWDCYAQNPTYNVYLSDNFEDVSNRQSSLIADDITDSNYFKTGLVSQTTYYWAVDVNEYGTIVPSGVISFTTDYNYARNPLPADGDLFAVTEELSWTPSLLMTSQDVYFGTDSELVTSQNPAVRIAHNTTASSVSFESLTQGQNYYWLVDTLSAEGTNSQSLWSFTAGDQTDPSNDPSLIGWWKFEDPCGIYALDYSGNGHHGTINNASIVNDPERGAVMSFNGNGFVSIPPEAFDSLDDQVTFCLWIYGGDSQPRNDSCFWGSNSQGTRIFNVHLPWSSSYVTLDLGCDSGGYDRISSPADHHQYKGKWNHWAFTKDTNTGMIKAYLNGELWNYGSGYTKPLSGTVQFKIGSNANGTNDFYTGLIDDFRVYNRALSANEIESIAAGTPLLCLEYPQGDLNKDCVVNYLDFAVLASNWLKKSDDQVAEGYFSDNVSSYLFIDATWSHKLQRADNKVLVVAIALEGSDPQAMAADSMTYNAVEMHPVPGSEVIVDSGSNYLKTQMFYLLDDELPLRPGHYTVALTCHGSVKQRLGGSVSRGNVAQQTPEAVVSNYKFGQNSISTDITTQTDNAWVLDVVACDLSGTFMPTQGDMIEQWHSKGNDGNTTNAGSSKSLPLEGQTTMSWQFNTTPAMIAHSVISFETLD